MNVADLFADEIENPRLDTAITATLERQAEEATVPDIDVDRLLASPGSAPIRETRSGRRRGAMILVAVAVVVAAAAGIIAVLNAAGSDQIETGPADGPAPMPTRPDSAVDPQPTTDQNPGDVPWLEPRLAPVSLTTPQVELLATSLTITVDGKIFSPVAEDAADLEIHSDPGSANYTTLETAWTQHGVPMRLFLYFEADDVSWSVTEARIYDGSAQGEWISMPRPRLAAPIDGQLVVNRFEMGAGSVVIEDLHLRPFLLPTACETADGPVLVNDYEEIQIQPGANGFGTNVRLIDPQTCTAVDLSELTFTIEVGDSSVVTVEPVTLLSADDAGEPMANLSIQRVGPGETSIEVVATGADGTAYSILIPVAVLAG